MAGGEDDFGTPWPMRAVGEAEKDKDAKQFCELAPFDDAVVVPGFVNGTYFAIVRGVVRCANMSVQLVPLVYIDKPDYWGIQVVACVGDICLPTQTPYLVWLDVTSTRGHKGIEIIGANRPLRIDIP